MLNLSDRHQEILWTLARSDGMLTGQQLSEVLEISIRTLQNEMVSLKEWGLVESSNRGYVLNSDKYDQLNQELMPHGRETDLSRILQKLLLADHKLNIYDLAEELYLSITTLRSRLKEVEDYVQSLNLTLFIRKNDLWIEGTEFNKRQAIRAMICYEITPGLVSVENYGSLFEGLDVIWVHQIIRDVVQNHQSFLQESCSSSLFLNIDIAIYRIQQGIHLPPDVKSELAQDSLEYQVAEEVCEKCGTKLGIQFPDSECAYVAGLFYGQLLTNQGADVSALDPELMKLEEEVSEIIGEVFEHYMIAIDFAPYIRNITLHIKDLIKRGSYKNYSVNDAYLNIRNDYPFVHDVSVLLAKKLEKVYEIEIPEEETGFLSIHLGVMIENSLHESDALNVLVLASEYQNIANRIDSWLQESYSGVIDVSRAVGDFRTTACNIADLIISTQALHLIGKEVVQISPFLTIMDRVRIDTAIRKCLQDKETKRNNTYLASCFHEKLFFRNPPITNRDEAIHFLGQQMVDFGVVDSGFVESVIERESLSSTCFFERFAIPHPLEMNAKKTMIAVLISDQGIMWESQKIKFCMLFAINREDRKLFSKAYNGAVRTLCDEKKLVELTKCETLSKFIRILKG